MTVTIDYYAGFTGSTADSRPDLFLTDDSRMVKFKEAYCAGKFQTFNFFLSSATAIYKRMSCNPSNALFRLTLSVISWLFWCSTTGSWMTLAWKPTEMWQEKVIYGSQWAFKLSLQATLLQIWMKTCTFLVSFLDKALRTNDKVRLSFNVQDGNEGSFCFGGNVTFA